MTATAKTSALKSFPRLKLSSSLTNSKKQNDEKPLDDDKKRTLMMRQQQLQSTYSMMSLKPGMMLRGISEKLDNTHLYDFDEDDLEDNYDINEEIAETKYEDDDYFEEMTMNPEYSVAPPSLGNDAPAMDPHGPSVTFKEPSGTTDGTDVPAGDLSVASTEMTRELVRKYICEIWTLADFNAIPEICSPKIRVNKHDSGLDKVGHEGLATMVSDIHMSFMDYHCSIHSIVVEGNKAFCRLRITGKHTGTFMGYPPTGQRVTWTAAKEFTCVDGVILKVWELADMKMLEEQLKMQCYEENCLLQTY